MAGSIGTHKAGEPGGFMPLGRLAVAMAFLSLLGSITNLLYLSPFVLALLPFAGLELCVRPWANRTVLATAAFLIYLFAWTVAYDPGALIDFDFYRRDGNVFVAYPALLALALIPHDIDPFSVLRIFILYGGAVVVVTMIGFFASGYQVFGYERDHIYLLLFESHNAAGGFLGVLVAFALGAWWVRRRGIYLLASGASLLGLVLTNSRGSIVALLGAVVICAVGRYLRLAMIVGMIVLQIAVVSFAYQVVPPYLYLRPHASAANTFGTYNLDELERGGTIIRRIFYVWPTTAYLFLHSPVFGTGLGSFDDFPYHLVEWAPGVQVNEPENFFHTSSHAHNSYLHILAETGAVGLLLLFWMLGQMNGAIRRLSPELRHPLMLALWFHILSSFTEHRITSPSQVLPFVIVLGLALSWKSTCPAMLRQASPVAASGI